MRLDLLPSDPDQPLTARDFALTGPSETCDPLCRPVRGDLAHIRCAGRVFVPHYAVPMAMRVIVGGTALTTTDRADAPVLATLALDTVFHALDLAGGRAWGQVGDDGLVGYVAAAALVPA